MQPFKGAHVRDGIVTATHCWAYSLAHARRQCMQLSRLISVPADIP
jgi:hypothetical protein